MPIVHSHALPMNAWKSGNIARTIDPWIYSGDNGTKGTVMANLDRAGGGFSITPDGTDNDIETAYYSGETVDPTTAGKRFGFRCLMNFTEADTNDYDGNWLIGFSDAVGTSVWDHSGDPSVLADQDAFGFYKVENSAFFRTLDRNGSTNNGSTLTDAFVSGTTYLLEMVCETGTLGVSSKFYIDSEEVATIENSSLTGLGLMHPIVGVHADGANQDVLEIYNFEFWTI